MSTIPEELSAASVLDEQGASRPLGSTWRERTALLVFVRHFG
jgi:hypothetical protein